MNWNSGRFITAAAFLPAVFAYYLRLWSLPHYQFFPLALAGAALLGYRAVNERPSIESAGRGWQWIAGAGLLLLGTSVVLRSPWLGCVAALVTVVAGLYQKGGIAELRRFAPAGLMVLITLRLPLNADRLLIVRLQEITARLASGTLDVLGVTHALVGNGVEISGRRLLVEEACSGINSFYSGLACALFYLLWTRRHWFVWIVLLTSVPVWVVFANTARIVLVVGMRVKWGIEADEGLLHDILGIGTFAAALSLIFSTEQLLRFYTAVLPPDEFAPSPSPSAGESVPATNGPTTGGRRILAVAAAVLLVLQLPILAGDVRDFAQTLRTAQVRELGAEVLPPTVADWKRTGYRTPLRDRGSAFGEHSQTWTYSGPTSHAAVSIDYPFLGWHELTECYTAQGWGVESRQVIDDPVSRRSLIEVRMRHFQNGRYGFLVFALLARDGELLEPRRRGEIDELRDRFTTNLAPLRFWRSAPDERRSVSFQIQSFVESYVPVTDRDVDDVHALFGLLHGRLVADWSNLVQ